MEVRKYEWIEVGRCFQKAIHVKRWYAKPSIKIQK